MDSPQFGHAAAPPEDRFQGMIWFGDYFGGNLTRFDPKTQHLRSSSSRAHANALWNGRGSQRQSLVRIDVYGCDRKTRSQNRQSDRVSDAVWRTRNAGHVRGCSGTNLVWRATLWESRLRAPEGRFSQDPGAKVTSFESRRTEYLAFSLRLFLETYSAIRYIHRSHGSVCQTSLPFSVLSRSRSMIVDFELSSIACPRTRSE